RKKERCRVSPFIGPPPPLFPGPAQRHLDDLPGPLPTHPADHLPDLLQRPLALSIEAELQLDRPPLPLPQLAQLCSHVVVYPWFGLPLEDVAGNVGQAGWERIGRLRLARASG